MLKKTVSGIMLILLLICMLTLAFNIQPVTTEVRDTKATSSSSGSSWPMLRHDFEHTGETEDPGPVTNRTAWITNVGSSVTSSPAVMYGRVYVASNRGPTEGYINCLDEMNGTVLWSSPLAGISTKSSPAFGLGMVFVGSYRSLPVIPPVIRGYVQAFDATTGALIWTFTAGGSIESSPIFWSNRIYVGSNDGKLYALNAATGAHIWNYTTGGPVRSSPAVNEFGQPIFGSDDGRIYALNWAGAQMWNFSTGGAVQSSPALSIWMEDLFIGTFHKVVFIGSNDGNLYMLNRTSGAQLANFTVGAPVRSSPALWSQYADIGGLSVRFAIGIFVGSDDNQIRMLDVSMGTPSLNLSWNTSTGGSVESSPAKISPIPDYPVSPILYVGSNDGKVYSFNRTGSVIWSYQTGGQVKSSPAVDEGWVFVGSSDGNVYAFGTLKNVDMIAVWQHLTHDQEFDAWYSIWDDHTKSWWTPTGAEAAPIEQPFSMSPQRDMDANIAFDRNGNSIAIWASGPRANPLLGYDIYYSRLPSQWSHPFGWMDPLEFQIQGNDTDPAIAFDDNGWAIALWVHEFLNGTKVVFYQRTRWIGTTFSWTVPEPLIPLPNNWPGNASLPEITFTSLEASVAGNVTPHQAVAIWTDWNKTEAQFRTYYAIWNGREWTNATGASSVEETPGQTVEAASNGLPATFRNGISSDKLGNTNAVWATISPTGQVYYSIWNGSSWTNASPILTPESIGYMPAVAYNWTNYATLVCTAQYPGPTLDIDYHQYDSTFPSWKPGGKAANSSTDDKRPAIAFLDADTTMAVWWNGTTLSNEISYSRWDGTAWSTAMPIVSLTLPGRDLNPAIASLSGSPSSPPAFYTLMITMAVGGTTNPSPGTYTYAPGTRTSVTALPDVWSTFDHWELDSINVGTTNPITVTMDADRTLLAVFMHDWPMFRHDLTHSGYSPSPPPNTNATLWNYTTGSYVYSSPAVVDGRVFVGSYDNKIYALNATTGTHLWNYTTGFVIYSSPAVADGRVFVGSRDGKLYAMNATTGAHIWNYTTGGVIWSSPVVADGRVYIGSEDGRVYALNATTGALIWSYLTGERVNSSPAVADGRVYVGSYDRKVYALNATDGTFIWSYTTGSYVFSSPAVVNDIVYIGSRDFKIYALNASNGAFIWSYTTGNQVESSPAVAYGMVFVGSTDGKLYALNAATGAHIWNYTTGGVVNSSPAVADGKVLVGSHDNKVYALNATTGVLIWSYTTSEPVESSPAVADGKVFIGSGDGKVYAFGYNHDIAITNVTLSKTVVGQGYTMHINVTVQNQGNIIETFNVTVYANTTIIETKTNITLTSGNSTTLTFAWNTSGFAKGNYTISAYAWPVPGETDTTDNTFTNGWVIVAMIGDIDGDGRVSGLDLTTVAWSFGSYPGHPRWNPNTDIDGDNKVSGYDLTVTAKNFGKADP